MHFIHTLLTLLTASVLGAAIGYERQFRQRTAGLRTNTLVATSAAIFVHLAMTIDGSGGAVRVISYVVYGGGRGRRRHCRNRHHVSVLTRYRPQRALRPVHYLSCARPVILSFNSGLYFHKITPIFTLMIFVDAPFNK